MPTNFSSANLPPLPPLWPAVATLIVAACLWLCVALASGSANDQPVERLPLIRIWTMPGCTPCETAKRELTRAGIEFTASANAVDHPVGLHRLEKRPIVYWIEGGRTWYIEGWYGPADLRRRITATRRLKPATSGP